MSEFKTNDYVVLVKAGTKDLLLQIIDHKYTNDLYRVKIVSTGQCGPAFKDELRLAEQEEIAAGRRREECFHEWNETTSNGDKYRFFVCKHCDSTRNFEPLESLDKPENHISPNCKSKDV